MAYMTPTAISTPYWNTTPQRQTLAAPTQSSLSYPYSPYSPTTLRQSGVEAAYSKTPTLTGVSKDVFKTLSPLQAVGLFSAGLLTAVGLRWFTRGLIQPKLASRPQVSLKALRHSALNGGKPEIERQTAVYFQRGLEGVVMMALKYPELQTRLKAYLGAGVLGYAAGSFAQGTQEVWVRREETQIRASLLDSLKATFQESLQKKIQYDQSLRQYARHELTRLYHRHRVPSPDKLIAPAETPDFSKLSNTQTLDTWRYPFEPVHFSQPLPAMAGRRNEPLNQDLQDVRLLEETSEDTAAKQRRNHMKTLVYGVGLATGLLLQGFNHLLAQAQPVATKASRTVAKSGVKHTLLEITNAMDREAMFLMGSNKILVSVLGLSAAARVGKLLLDGYREIEVTRQHADTERRYQRYNWLGLDPSFHAISEKEGLHAQIQRLDRTLTNYPRLLENRDYLAQAAQTILQNVGRESAPRYFPMTPAVNLVAARS